MPSYDKFSKIEGTAGPDTGKESAEGPPFGWHSVQRRNSAEEEFLGVFEHLSNRPCSLVGCIGSAARLGQASSGALPCSVCCIGTFGREERAVEYLLVS